MYVCHRSSSSSVDDSCSYETLLVLGRAGVSVPNSDQLDEYFRRLTVNPQCLAAASQLDVVTDPGKAMVTQLYDTTSIRFLFEFDSTGTRLRFHSRSTPIRLDFDRATTVRRPTLRPGCCTAAQVIGLRDCGLRVSGSCYDTVTLVTFDKQSNGRRSRSEVES